MKAEEKIFGETASALKVLGHPTRLQILQILSVSKKLGLSVTHIHEKLEIGQPEASKHLIALRNQGVLKMEKRGGFSFYRVNPELTYLQPLIRFINTPK